MFFSFQTQTESELKNTHGHLCVSYCVSYVYQIEFLSSKYVHRNLDFDWRYVDM